MSKIIKLTRTVSGEERTVYINSAQVTYFQWIEKYKTTRIRFATDGENNQISVKESAEEIEELLK